MSDEEQRQWFVAVAAAIGALIMIARLLLGDLMDFGPPPEFERSVGGVILWIGVWAFRVLGAAIVGACFGGLAGVFLAYTEIGGCLVILVLLMVLAVPLMAIVWILGWIIEGLRLIRF